MGIKVQGVTKAEYVEYCIPNKLDPLMFKLRVERLGWTREQAATTPLGIVNEEKFFSHEEMGILIESAPYKKPSELMELLPGRNKNAISRRKTMLGLGLAEAKIKEIRIANGKKNAKVDYDLKLSDLEADEKSVLFGCLLGEGSISYPSNIGLHTECLFTCTHSSKQGGYNLWKAEMLDTFCPSAFEDRNGSVKIDTCRHPIFKQLRAAVYGDRYKERIPNFISSSLGYIGLLIWYLDSGHLSKYEYKEGGLGIRRGYMSISTEHMLETEVRGAVDCINACLGLALYVRGGNEICFDTESTIKLIPIFEELFIRYEIPDCMLYKIGLDSLDELVGLRYFGIEDRIFDWR